MEEAKDFNEEDMKKTYIIYVSFIITWVGIFVIVTIKSKVYSTIDSTKKTITEFLKSIVDNGNNKITPVQTNDMKQKLHEYIHSFIPVIYHDHISPVNRFFKQLLRSHSLSELVNDKDRHASLTTKVYIYSNTYNYTYYYY